ncbi:MAG: citrate lyase holo-[Mogibacterium sp.]|nr:citrate lyase holo-[acyl-carrier protein] synthase [Mogibacterium sp.]MBQ7214921.1 citrate lyase holo-[acyl-carrier protein] synthase [Synergistaceae bacterium]
MTGNIVDLQHMLARREARYLQQQSFLQAHHCPVVSFSMNIPGPIKTNTLIRKAFTLGRKLLLCQLEKAGAELLALSEIHEDTGDELLLCVGNIQPEILKDIAVNIEDASELGRLYDIDVIDADGKKLSRPQFRKCLICSKQAQECARSRTHSVSEMQTAIENILQNLHSICDN